MDRNTILAIALSIAVYSVWLGYQSSLQPPPDAAPASSELLAADGGSVDQAEPTGVIDDADDARVMNDADDAAASTETSLPGERPRPAVARVEPWKGVIEGERFVAQLSNRGASLTGWTLRDFQQIENGSEAGPIELVNAPAGTPGALTMPFEDLGLGDLSGELFEVESHGRDSVAFRLERGGLEIRKRYAFDLSGYGFEMTVEVRNGSGHLVAPDFTVAWPAAQREGNDYTEQSVVVLHAEDLSREQIASVGGSGFMGIGASDAGLVFRDVSWAGVDLKYFASVLLPSDTEGTRAEFESLEEGQAAVTRLAYPPAELAPGQSISRSWQAFLGPKQPAILEQIGRGLERSVDLGYSWFEPLTLFFQWLIHVCYGIVPNYGWSIILITILVRVAMLPIMNRQMRSMEKMRALQPRMKEIQEKFADDRQKQSEAMMALYKETGVNPLGGCLPMLLQFPVFIGLFFALQSSFDLRQAPFILWIDDLSAPEMLFAVPGLDFPIRLLPIIMGGSMILQQKLTPTTVDPSQQMMMMVMMPVMMTVLFYQFPSGLVLYWMVSNFLGIAHQLLIGRRMKAEAAA